MPSVKIISAAPDDCGDMCWELEGGEWVSCVDHDVLVKEGKEDVIKAIEQHGDFCGWQEKCVGCCASVENCQSESDDCVKVVGIHGDERLDKYVRATYGESMDWVLLSSLEEGQEVVLRLEDFVVLDDNGGKETGIAIIKADSK